MCTWRAAASRPTASALQAGDALKLIGRSAVTLTDGADAEVLVFDLA